MAWNIEKFLELYRNGYYSRIMVFSRLLDLLSCDTIPDLIPRLPVQVYNDLREYVASYAPGEMIYINCDQRPDEEQQVAAIRKWIEEHPSFQGVEMAIDLKPGPSSVNPQ